MHPSKLLARWRQRKNKHRNKLRYKTRSAQMELLEPRHLMANLLVTSAADAGAGSLREMIATANGNSQADTITFAAGITTVTLTSGELDLSETGAGNKTTITGPVTLSGNNASRLFVVRPGVAAVLDNLTLTKGRSREGGAIFSHGTLTISNSTLVDNESTGGSGAIRIPVGGSVAIINSTLSNNRAAGFGGAIDNASLLTVTNSTITGNRADIDGNGNEFGGGINTLTDAQVAFKADYLADEDRLLFTDQNGITGSFDIPTGVLNLTGTASVAHYQQALRSVQYTNTRVNPVPEYRELAFTIADGDKHSLEADFLIDVETVLQAPIITLDTAEQTFV